MTKYLKPSALGVMLIAGVAVAGTATWDGFEDQMSAHAAAVAAAGASSSAVGDAAVAGAAPSTGATTAALTAENPVDTRFTMLVESAETGLVARSCALVINFR